MTDIEFKATLQMLIPMLIHTIMDYKKITVIEAIKLLYVSKLYKKLEVEKTKLWRLSPLALFELLDNEITKGILDFPTEA